MMTKLCGWIRLPLTLVGFALLFAADRYLGAETYNAKLRIVAFALAGAGLLATIARAFFVGNQGLANEGKSFKIASLWQVLVLAGMGLYIAYGKSLGPTGAPETAAHKVLLAAWLVSCLLGFFMGAGTEWALRESGRGPNAEPMRVLRSGGAWLSVGLFLASLICINFAADKKNEAADWSYLKTRTPSGSTLAILKSVKEPVTIALFYPPGNEVRTLIADYFAAVAAAEPRVKLESYDKDVNPTAAEQHRVSRNGQIVFDVGGKKSRIETGTTIAKARKTLKELDQEFQKSFLEVASEKKTLYFTRGHGEASWVGETGDDPLRSLRKIEGFLRSQNYTTRLFGMAEGTAEKWPDDASAVLIVGPTQPFRPEEVVELKAYVERGGSLYVLLDVDRGTQETAGMTAGDLSDDPLRQYLAGMGLRYNEVPIGNEKDYYPANHAPSDVWSLLTNVFTTHDSVTSLGRNDERIALLAYRTGYWSVTPELGKWKNAETVRTLPDSFPDKNKNYKADPDEKKDAYVIGVASEPKEKKPGILSRVAVFGDATTIADAVVQNPANAVYFVDTLKWLVGKSELQGEVATAEDVKIRHTKKEDAIWFHGTVVVVPLLVLGAGFIATRRKREGDHRDPVKSKKGAGDAA